MVAAIPSINSFHSSGRLSVSSIRVAFSGDEQKGQLIQLKQFSDIYQTTGLTKLQRRDRNVEDREGNSWFFLYSTTAALTGLFIIVIFLCRPDNLLPGRFILGTASICIIVFSLPIRKGIALALEFLSEQKGDRFLLYDDEDENHLHQ